MMQGIGRRGNGRGNGKGYRRGFRRRMGRSYSISDFGESFMQGREEQYLANRIYEILPKLDCKACGHSSCMDCAKAIANGSERYDVCRILKPEQKEKIKEIMGDNHV